MTAPTITAIDPTEGHPGGQFLLRVEGADFQLPSAVAASGYVGGTVEVTMELEIDGVLATDVRVFSSTLLTAVVPAYAGDPGALETGLAVDVTIRNLDSGPGPEETNYTGLFTFRRPNLANREGIVVRVIREFILTLRRQIIDNVVLSTDLAFDPETGDALDTVALAETPGIALFGPTLSEDKFRRESRGEAPQNSGQTEYTRYRESVYMTLGFEGVIVVKDSMIELLQLIQEVVLHFRRNTDLVIAVDPNDSSLGTAELELWLTSPPSVTDVVDLGGTRSASFNCEIVGLPIDDDTWLPIEWGTVLADPPDLTLSNEQIEDT